MTDTDKKKGRGGKSVGKSLLGLLIKFEEEKDEGTSDSAVLEDLSREVSALTNAPRPEPAKAEATDTAIEELDLQEVYAKAGVKGDLNTDSLLEAFSGMTSSNLEGIALRTAMNTMAKAVRADKATVASTLENRIAALDAVLAARQQIVEVKSLASQNHLAEVQKKTEEEVRQLEGQIQTLRKELATLQESSQRQNAEAIGAIEALKHRVVQEKQRLATFKDFLAGEMGQSPPSKH